MIRRSTIVYLVLLLALAGAYLVWNNREEPADAEPTGEPTAQVSYLFNAEAGTPSSIRVESESGEAVEIALDAENAWMLTEPVEAKADPAAAGAAASQITTMQILDTPPDVDPKIIGLDNPEHVLTIKFTSGEERTVDVGVVTPSESGYYVREAGKIVIVSRDAIDALLGLLMNPPYLATEPPGLVPELETSTPLPSTPEADTAPTATATP